MGVNYYGYDPMAAAAGRAKTKQQLGQIGAGLVTALGSIASDFATAQEGLKRGDITIADAYTTAVQAATAELEPLVGADRASQIVRSNLRAPTREDRGRIEEYLAYLKSGGDTIDAIIQKQQQAQVQAGAREALGPQPTGRELAGPVQPGEPPLRALERPQTREQAYGRLSTAEYPAGTTAQDVLASPIARFGLESLPSGMEQRKAALQERQIERRTDLDQYRRDRLAFDQFKFAITDEQKRMAAIRQMQPHVGRYKADLAESQGKIKRLTKLIENPPEYKPDTFIPFDMEEAKADLALETEIATALTNIIGDFEMLQKKEFQPTAERMKTGAAGRGTPPPAVESPPSSTSTGTTRKIQSGKYTVEY